MNDIAEKIKLRNKVKRYITIIISLTLSAICYNLFFLNLNIVAGGINGVATITKHVFKIDQSLMLFILSVIFLVVSYIFLGKEKTLTTTFASLAYPALVKLTEPLINIISIDTSDLFIIVIFAGLLSGLANGLMYKTGYNSGGFNVISQILYEKIHFPVAQSVFIINAIIVVIGAFYFGTTKAMYAVIELYINNIIMDKVLLGISNNKAFYIITTKEKLVSDYVMNNLGHGVTSFDVKGGFLEKKKKVLLTVVPTRDYYRLTEGIKMIDKDVFFVSTDSYEVEGAS